jgi:disulfide bond formation protein DsbB
LSVDQVSLFLALLAVVAELATVTAIVLAVGGRFSPALRQLGRQAVEAVAPSGLALAATVATVCMAGSLYFSEVAHFPPCHLCWLQRFCMYPLVPVLWIAAFAGGSRRRGRGDTPQPPGRQAGRVRPYAAAVAFVGACISTYHVALEHHPEWESSVCDPKNPCTLIWVKRLGYLTIPTMALSGFALIITLLAISREEPPDGNRPVEAEAERSRRGP